MASDRVRDRAVATLIAGACGDALGAPFEGSIPPPGWAEMAGVPGRLEPGEWTDDTSMTIAIAEIAATGVDLRTDPALDAIGDRFLEWYRLGAPGIGLNTRRVLSQADSGADLRLAARLGSDSGGLSGGNGALMRTAPVALANLGDDTALMEAARAVASLTHHDELAGESCAVWCIAIDRAIREDRLDGSWDALDLLPAHSRERWSGWLAATPKGSAMSFKPNGFTVHCLQAALAVVLQNAGAELADSLRAAVEVGDDTDTVACVTGALLGARWGAAAVPARWRNRLHDRWGHSPKDLERLALAIIDCH